MAAFLFNTPGFFVGAFICNVFFHGNDGALLIIAYVLQVALLTPVWYALLLIPGALVDQGRDPPVTHRPTPPDDPPTA
jgi:hypothetical protein